jgi:sugar phosphate isomerase/epimerase
MIMNLQRRIMLLGAISLMAATGLNAGNGPVREIQQPRFGVCTSLGRSDLLRSIGFDYLEASVLRDLMPGKPDEEFELKRAEFEACGLPVMACNGFLPADLKVTGPDARHDTILKYAETAFRRAKAVGVQIIVFGSSGARSVPVGFDRDLARTQFVSLLRALGPIAAVNGIVIAVENLQESETNFINTLGEAIDVVRAANHPNVGVCADFFHMLRQNESPEVLLTAGNVLVHCHLAEKQNRTAPGVQGEDFRPFFQALEKAGYRGGVSIEGSWRSEELAEALRVLREQSRPDH